MVRLPSRPSERQLAARLGFRHVLRRGGVAPADYPVAVGEPHGTVGVAVAGVPGLDDALRGGLVEGVEAGVGLAAYHHFFDVGVGQHRRGSGKEGEEDGGLHFGFRGDPGEELPAGL